MVRSAPLARSAVFVLGFAFFAALAVPITVSFDGILYLQSSAYIFDELAFDRFQWSREPLFAVLIRLIRILGGTGSVWIVGAQAAAAAAAALIVTGAVLGRSWLRWVAVALILLNPLVLGYAGSLLQQTWFTLILALQTGLIWLAHGRRAPTWMIVAGMIAVTILSVHLLAALGYVSAVSAGFVTWFLARGATHGREDSGDKGFLIHLRRPAVAVLATVAVVAIGRLSLMPWQDYKEAQLAGRDSNSLGIPAYLAQASPFQILATLPSTLPETAQTASIILDIPLPGASSTFGGDENEFFGFSAFEPGRRCGVIQTNDFIKVASEEAPLLLTATCVSKGFSTGIARLVGPGRPLHKLSSLAFVTGLLLIFFRRGRTALVMLSPFYAYLAMYSIYGASLDRYGVPIYPAAVTLLVLQLACVSTWIRVGVKKLAGARQRGYGVPTEGGEKPDASKRAAGAADA